MGSNQQVRISSNLNSCILAQASDYKQFNCAHKMYSEVYKKYIIKGGVYIWCSKSHCNYKGQSY
jgi:hypothetical protein